MTVVTIKQDKTTFCHKFKSRKVKLDINGGHKRFMSLQSQRWTSYERHKRRNGVNILGYCHNRFRFIQYNTRSRSLNNRYLLNNFTIRFCLVFYCRYLFFVKAGYSIVSQIK